MGSRQLFVRVGCLKDGQGSEGVIEYVPGEVDPGSQLPALALARTERTCRLLFFEFGRWRNSLVEIRNCDLSFVDRLENPHPIPSRHSSSFGSIGQARDGSAAINERDRRVWGFRRRFPNRATGGERTRALPNPDSIMRSHRFKNSR